MDLQLEIAPGRGVRRELERELRERIRSGRLHPGTRLPSTRALAGQLGVSRGVVVEAYAQLAAEGYLTARQGAATSVAPGVMGAVADPVAPSRPRRVRYDFRTVPDLAAFPRRAWARASHEVLRTLPDARLGYGPPEGAPELRAALAAYLGRTRGTVADPEHVIVGPGLRGVLSILWRVLGETGASRVAIEDPGWRGQGETVRDAGLEALTVPVDEDGVVVDRLERTRADAVVVTPAHQFPTGAVLSAARRTALVAWARRAGALIVEDDYDAQYRYDREPVGALQGLASDCVVHGGSVSKVLVPALRIGWLALPGHLVEPARAYLRATRQGTPVLEQVALANFIERGTLDRHLRHTRRLYRRRRALLLEALARHLPDPPAEGATAGLHVALRLPAGTDVAGVSRAAAERGLAIEALGGADRARVLLGYGALPEPAIDSAVRALADVLRARGIVPR